MQQNTNDTKFLNKFSAEHDMEYIDFLKECLADVRRRKTESENALTEIDDPIAKQLISDLIIGYTHEIEDLTKDLKSHGIIV